VLEQIHHLRIGEDRRYGIEASGERFSHKGEVRLDALMLPGEELVGASEAGLDLVEDMLDLPRIADVAKIPKVSVRRDPHTSLALNRLDEDAHGPLVTRRLGAPPGL
jgi:hypothetical protein